MSFTLVCQVGKKAHVINAKLTFHACQVIQELYTKRRRVSGLEQHAGVFELSD